MLIRTTVTNDELLERSAKAFVTLYLGIDLRAWSLTQDQAWVSLTERLLKTHKPVKIQPISAYGIVGQQGFFDLFKVTFDLANEELQLIQNK